MAEPKPTAATLGPFQDAVANAAQRAIAIAVANVIAVVARRYNVTPDECREWIAAGENK